MQRWLLVVMIAACSAPAPRPVAAPPSNEPFCVETKPVALVVAPESLTTADTPKALTVPEPLIAAVMRSGKDRVVYTIDVCEGARDGVAKSTGFGDLDRFLDASLASLALAVPGRCATVTLILGAFSRACVPRQTLL